MQDLKQMDLKIGKRYKLKSVGKDPYIVEIIAIGRFIKSVQITNILRCEPDEYCKEVFESIFEPIEPKQGE